MSRRASRRLSLPVPLPRRWSTAPPPNPKSTASFKDINTDILLMVLQHVNWPEDYHSLSLVSRSFNRLVVPELYKTIVLTSNPHPTLPLLSHLERNPELRKCVHILIFDSVVRSLKPRIPSIEDFDQVRERDLTDGEAHMAFASEVMTGDPHRIRLKLHTVLPRLSNLHTICVKQWVHILHGPLSASECYNYWQPDASRQKGVWNKFRVKRPYAGPPAVMHGDRQPGPIDIISLLLIRCQNIKRVYIVGIFHKIQFSNHPIAFDNLTVLVIGEPSAGANTWNEILRNCKCLKVLGLLNVQFRFEKLLAGCHFPFLESIEWYNYAFTSAAVRKHITPFADFIHDHSDTLKCISLAPKSCQVRGFPFDGGHHFFRPDTELLPNLETLRLHNWTEFSFDHDRWPHSDSSQARTLAEDLLNFVEKRPNIVDLAITDLQPDLAARLRDEILPKRRMKRALVEECARDSDSLYSLESVDEPVGGSISWTLPGGRLRRKQAEWKRSQKMQYLRDAWQSYELMFAGLALESSGYRPWFSNSKCPRSWTDYFR